MKRYFNICLITVVLFVFTGCVERNVKVTTQTKTSNMEYLNLKAIVVMTQVCEL